jgi:hypothetical protein
VELAKELGLTIGAIDVRTDGVTVHATPQPAENAYDRWKREDDARKKAKARLAQGSLGGVGLK